MNIYLFSGLGADRRVFDYLPLPTSARYVEWHTPLPNENIRSYAARLIQEQINPTDNGIMLIGVSFGGMMAIEVAKLISVDRVVLISSAKTRTEIPFLFRTIGAVGILNWLPMSPLKWYSPLTAWFFGANTNIQRQLLRDILRETDPFFLRWALQQIVAWDNETIPTGLTHLHGTSDRLIWYTGIQNAVPIQGGGHLMIIDRSDEIFTFLVKFGLD